MPGGPELSLAEPAGYQKKLNDPGTYGMLDIHRKSPRLPEVPHMQEQTEEDHQGCRGERFEERHRYPALTAKAMTATTQSGHSFARTEAEIIKKAPAMEMGKAVPEVVSCRTYNSSGTLGDRCHQQK